MHEEPSIIQMNIARYSAMLKLDMDDERRSMLQHMLAEAQQCLVVANDGKKPQKPQLFS